MKSIVGYLLRAPEAFCFVPAESEAKRRAEQHANHKTPIQYGNSPGSNKRQKPRRKAGKLYDANTYRRAIHRACDRAFPAPTELTGDEKNSWLSDHRWSPNQLRHAAATEIRKRFDIESAQVVLGHPTQSYDHHARTRERDPFQRRGPVLIQRTAAACRLSIGACGGGFFHKADHMTGTVARIVFDRGFGFLRRDDGGADCFFHCRDLEGLPFDEQLVERVVAFDVVPGDKGPRATRVRAT